MKSFIAGALLGAALGAAAMFAWIGPDEVSSTEKMTWEEPGTTKRDGATPSPQEKPKTKRNPRNPFDVVETSPAGPTVAHSNVPASKAIPSGSETLLSPSEAKTPIDSSIAPANPIPMSEAHREMLKTVRENGRLVQEQHVALEQERRDESWSHYMEQMLNSYLSARAPQAGVEIVNIECRTTKCEIQAFDDRGPNTLSGILGQATKETWWEFSSMDAQASDYGARTRTLIFLGRHMKTQDALQKVTT